MQRAVAGVAAASLPLSAARAQVINQTARVIVPFPAGGTTDTLARIMADGLKGAYAPATIVENRVGGAGRIAVEYVKGAEADGSVMLFTPDFLITVYPHSFKSLNYDLGDGLHPGRNRCEIRALPQRRPRGAGQCQDARATSCNGARPIRRPRPTPPPRPAARRISPA